MSVTLMLLLIGFLIGLFTGITVTWYMVKLMGKLTDPEKEKLIKELANDAAS